VYLLDVMSGEILKSLPLPYDRPGPLAYSPDGRYLAASFGEPCRLGLWDVAAERIAADRPADSIDSVGFLLFSPDGGTLVGGGLQNVLQTWDVKTGTATELYWTTQIIWAAAFSPDGRYLAAYTLGGSLRIWTTEVLRS
jgi:WD40 repeat protein